MLALSNAPVAPAGLQRRLSSTWSVLQAPQARLLADGALETIRPDECGDRFVAMADWRSAVSLELYDLDFGLRIDRDPSARSAGSNVFS